MPYADPDAQRRYQREWRAQRRAEFFAGKTCARCGADEDLIIHHRETAEKVDHRVWSWSQRRRDAELAKCDVICDTCHREHHAAPLRGRTHGTSSCYRAGCRCDECREDHRQRTAAYRARRA